MSSGPSNNPSPSKSSEPSTRRQSSGTPVPSEASNQTAEPISCSDSAETPQAIAGTQNLAETAIARHSPTSHPGTTAPLIFINESPASRVNPEVDSLLRQGRSLAARHILRSSSSQSPHRSRTPYTRPASLVRAHSQPRAGPSTSLAAMSSASSSPGNTSTAGSSSGSNPSYQLPYAPFPYPMPKPQGGNGGSGK